MDPITLSMMALGSLGSAGGAPAGPSGIYGGPSINVQSPGATAAGDAGAGPGIPWDMVLIGVAAAVLLVLLKRK